jgi:ABC-2 type transport system ATP-binding protein
MPSVSSRRMGQLDQPVVIEVRDLRKSFRPKRKAGARVLRAIGRADRADERRRILHGLTFDVRRGELFGVIGRRGSGKTTLLRILASIFRSDGGTVRVAGRVAPLIELGVFNPALSVPENLALSGAMLGVSPGQMRDRLDVIRRLAGLTDVGAIEAKGLPAAMRFRLLFAATLAADPDILLLDELLGGAGAAYNRCVEELPRLRDEGKTVVLVTRRPGVLRHCDRAMLLEDGRIERLGAPAAVIARYRELTGAEAANGDAPPGAPEEPQAPAAITELRVGEAGDDAALVKRGEPIRVNAEITIANPIQEGWLQIALRDGDGARIFRSQSESAEHVLDLKPGERVRFAATIENQLPPGTYEARLTMRRLGPDGHRRAAPPRALVFDVDGGENGAAARLVQPLSLEHSVTIERDPAPQGRPV